MNMDFPKAQLLSIGEVAGALGLTRRMILNYEDRGLIVPDVKEGTAGNRYYTTDTLTRIRSIRIFQKLGLSLDEIRAYFADETDLVPLIARLEAMRDELNLSIEKLRVRLVDTDDAPRRVILPDVTVYARTLRAGTVEARKAQLRDVIPAAMRQYGSDTGRRMFFTEFPLHDPSLSTLLYRRPVRQHRRACALPAGAAGAALHAARRLCGAACHARAAARCRRKNAAADTRHLPAHLHRGTGAAP